MKLIARRVLKIEEAEKHCEKMEMRNPMTDKRKRDGVQQLMINTLLSVREKHEKCLYSAITPLYRSLSLSL